MNLKDGRVGDGAYYNSNNIMVNDVQYKQYISVFVVFYFLSSAKGILHFLIILGAHLFFHPPPAIHSSITTHHNEKKEDKK
jgi:hypothetical protein